MTSDPATFSDRSPALHIGQLNIDDLWLNAVKAQQRQALRETAPALESLQTEIVPEAPGGSPNS
jgi:hypothetical protein